jgi:hypothetical protein
MNHGKCCTGSGSCSTRPAGFELVAIDVARKIDAPLARSVFRIPGMDCPSEEQMIRLCLADAPVASVMFDLLGRTLVVDHGGDAVGILKRLEPLGYGARLQQSTPLQSGEAIISSSENTAESRVLWILLGINALMFVVEMIAGWWGRSAGLISDAADMSADAAVYGVALYAVGRDAAHKLTAARCAGLLQLALAVGVISESGRRIVTGSSPEEIAMIGVSLLALAANVACLILISRYREGGAHMRASYIFSANDVLANLGVILAGVLVAWVGSPWPDGLIGFLIGMMVLMGAIRILRLR